MVKPTNHIWQTEEKATFISRNRIADVTTTPSAIIWIVHAFWLVYKCIFIDSVMKHENNLSIMVGCLQVVSVYSFMKEIKAYKHALIIVFLFLKMKNNFIKEIKHVLHASTAWWKPRQNWWKFLSRWKPRLHFRFSLICPWIPPNARYGFYQAMKVWKQSSIS